MTAPKKCMTSKLLALCNKKVFVRVFHNKVKIAELGGILFDRPSLFHVEHPDARICFNEENVTLLGDNMFVPYIEVHIK